MTPFKSIFKAIAYVGMLLFCPNLYAQNPPFEVDSLALKPPYIVLVTTYNDPGVYPPEITIEVVNTTTEKVIFYENSEEFANGFVFGKSHFELGGESVAILEFQKNTLANNSENAILILAPKADSVHRGVIKTRGHFEIKNLDEDTGKELIISEHLFNRLNVRGCRNSTIPS